jgi:hypothetical protein
LTDLLNHRYIGVLTAEDEESGKEFYFAGSGVKATSMGTRKSQPIGRFWTAAGAVDDAAMQAALQTQQERGGLIGDILVESEKITEDQRQAGLVEQLVEELSDLFFWPSPQYHYKPGHQTQVIITKHKREETTKSLSLKANLAQVIMRVKVEGRTLKDAGRALGGVGTPFLHTARAKDILFTREKFMALTPPQRMLLPLFSKPRSPGQLIEGAGIPWSQVLRETALFLKEDWIKAV